MRQPAGCTILNRSRFPYGEGSTSAKKPPSCAPPSLSIPPLCSCRDTRGKSALFRGGCNHPSLLRDRAAFACSILVYPPSHQRTFRCASPAGRTTGFPRFVGVPARGRSGFSAGNAASATGDACTPVPDPFPFLGQASQHLPLVSPHDVSKPFTAVDRTMPSSLPTPVMLGVATAAHACVTIPQDEAPLSQQLHTPPSPVTHVLGGDWWQNTRLCPVYTVITATPTTSCRTKRWLGAARTWHFISGPASHPCSYRSSHSAAARPPKSKVVLGA